MAKTNMDDFSSRLENIVTNGYLTVGLGIGHHHGFFKAFVDLDRAVSAGELAAHVGCKERLVREWLHQMAVAKIVEVDETGTIFSLPIDHRAALSSSNMTFAHILPPLVAHHSKLMNAFKEGGPNGVDTADLSYFLPIRQQGRPADMAASLPDVISQSPGLRQNLENGIDVVDIGTSRGHLIQWMSAMFPKSRFTGVDIDAAGIEAAQRMAEEKGLRNVTFVTGDAQNLPDEWTERFDYVIMFDVLHDLPHASKAAPGLYKILRPGGRLSIIDIHTHTNPIDNIGDGMIIKHHCISMYYCVTLSMRAEGSEALGKCAGIEKLGEIIEKGGFDLKGKGGVYKVGDQYAHFSCLK